MATLAVPLLDGVRELGPDVRALAPQIERDRELPVELVERLGSLGLFRLAAPSSRGGLESDPVTILQVVEELSRADASVGWTVMIGIATGVTLGYLDPASAAQILADPRFLIAGVSAPMA